MASTQNTDTLPSTRHFLTSLISTIATSTHHEQGNSNPLSDASPNTKSALLTLHTLFPNDFLPALDLLDRGLVTRFVLTPENDEQPADAEQPQLAAKDHEIGDARKQILAYHVRTAQKTSTRSRNTQQQPTASYEVRLEAWSCSCPAFAFATFPALLPAEEGGVEGGGDGVSTIGNYDSSDANEGWLAGGEWQCGGLTRGSDVPACKHLLACVVAERCKGFERLVEEKEVSVEEVAGWAAGWGDR